MDRISALRNVEDALSEFEDGEIDLGSMEIRVRSILRTYATNFEERDTYKASGPPPVDGLIVVANSPSDARERIRNLADGNIERFDIEIVDRQYE